MQENIWVSMPIIRSIVMNAAKSESDLQAICEAGNIKIEDLENADKKISLEENCAIMEAAASVSGDEFMGLHIGEKTTITVLGLTGHLMESSKDVLTVLQSLQQFTSMITQLFDFRIEVKNNHALYYSEPLEIWNVISPETARQSVDYSFSAALHILWLLTGKKLRPEVVKYRYTPVKNTAEYERIFKCKILFNQDSNYMAFNAADMHLPVIGYNKQLNSIFKNILEQELEKQKNGEPFSSRVREIILTNFGSIFPQLEEVAALMHITARTLQRKLNKENKSYTSLSNAVKKELALHLLSKDELTISDIAYKLGYSEPAAFRRAFVQWTGKAPACFRKS